MRPQDAVDKIGYMERLRTETVNYSFRTLVAFITLTGNLDRAIEKVKACGSNEIKVIGLRELTAWCN